jgi:sugar/nucleoside kinase (ribokinase family)
VEAIDTTAAGDVFNGAFAMGLMLGRGTVESACFAAAAAAISTQLDRRSPMIDAGDGGVEGMIVHTH